MALLPQSLLLFRAQTPTQFVVGAAVSVLVMVVMVGSRVVVFLIQGRGVGRSKALPLLLSLLQYTSVRKSTQPAEQFPVHLSPAFLFTVKRALLFTLLTGLRRAIFFL